MAISSLNLTHLNCFFFHLVTTWTLYLEARLLVYRPICIWTEAGRKTQRGLYFNINPSFLALVILLSNSHQFVIFNKFQILYGSTFVFGFLVLFENLSP